MFIIKKKVIELENRHVSTNLAQNTEWHKWKKSCDTTKLKSSHCIQPEPEPSENTGLFSDHSVC